MARPGAKADPAVRESAGQAQLAPVTQVARVARVAQQEPRALLATEAQASEVDWASWAALAAGRTAGCRTAERPQLQSRRRWSTPG